VQISRSVKLNLSIAAMQIPVLACSFRHPHRPDHTQARLAKTDSLGPGRLGYFGQDSPGYNRLEQRRAVTQKNRPDAGGPPRSVLRMGFPPGRTRVGQAHVAYLPRPQR
jgi:hypothetical protein